MRSLFGGKGEGGGAVRNGRAMDDRSPCFGGGEEGRRRRG